MPEPHVTRPRRKRVTLSEQPDELLRVVRALKDMGAQAVVIGDIRVAFGHEPAPDTKEFLKELSTEEKAKQREAEMFWSA